MPSSMSIYITLSDTKSEVLNNGYRITTPVD